MKLSSKTKLFGYEEQENNIVNDDYETNKELEEMLADNNNDSVAIKNNISNIVKVLDIYKETENKLNDTKMYNRDTKEVEENITEDIVNIVNENYIYTLGMLGIKRDELKYIDFSKEEFTPKQRIELSLEGILETIKQFFKKIINMLIVVGKKLKEWLIKITNLLNNEKSTLKKLKLKIHDMGNKEFKDFDNNIIEKLKNIFGVVLYVTDNKLNIQDITDYCRSDDINPFEQKLSSLYKFINVPKSAEDEGIKADKEKLMEEIRSISCKNKIHKGIIETVEEVDKSKCYYISKIKGKKIWYYGIKSDEDYTYGLPIKYLSCSITTWNEHPFQLEGITKYSDFNNYIKIIENNINNQNKYFNTILKLNSDALKLVKQYQNDILKDNEVNDGLKMAMKRNLSFLQSLGSQVAFDNCYQYGYLNKALIQVIKFSLKDT